MRTKLLKGPRPIAKELKLVIELVNELELSTSKIEDEDDKGKKAETPDQGDLANTIDLD